MDLCNVIVVLSILLQITNFLLYVLIVSFLCAISYGVTNFYILSFSYVFTDIYKTNLYCIAHLQGTLCSLVIALMCDN